MVVEFSSVTISFLIQATEDEARLLDQVSNQLQLSRENFSVEPMEGHFGNRITVAKAHITGTEADRVTTVLMSSLSQQAKKTLVSELEKSLDEHDALYLRLDRQSLGSEWIGLSDEEPIRVKLKPRIRVGGRRSMMEQYTELIQEA